MRPGGGATVCGMSERRTKTAEQSAMEADLLLRRLEREADDRARKLQQRLTRVDVHQQEARRILRQAGMLPRDRPR